MLPISTKERQHLNPDLIHNDKNIDIKKLSILRQTTNNKLAKSEKPLDGQEQAYKANRSCQTVNFIVLLINTLLFLLLYLHDLWKIVGSEHLELSQTYLMTRIDTTPRYKKIACLALFLEAIRGESWLEIPSYMKRRNRQLRSFHSDKFIELTPKTEAKRNSFYCRTIEELPSNFVDIEKKSMISEGA